MDWISIKADIVKVTRGSVTFDNDVRIRREAIHRIKYEDGTMSRIFPPIKGKMVLSVQVSDFVVRRIKR